jgi:DNA modification methylase
MNEVNTSYLNKKLEVKGYSGIYNCHKYWGKKPVELYELILKNFSEDKALVCDPFVGSGVLPSVCKSFGVDFIGCDLNPAALDIARIFIDPPSKNEAINVLNYLKKECEERINKSYTLSSGTLISHIVWNNEEIDEIWTKIGRSTKLVQATEEIKNEITYKTPLVLHHFKDRTLNKNSRINIAEGQKVSDLFTPRALQNIEFLLEAISKLNSNQQRIARFILSSSLGQMSKMVFAIGRRRKSSDPNNTKKYEVGSWVIGYWRPSVYFEINTWMVFEGRATRLINALGKAQKNLEATKTSRSNIQLSCEDAVEYLKKVESSSVDLVVTDPPHSDRIPYLELSEMWNTFLGYSSNLESEFIYSKSLGRKKSLDNYLLKFQEIFEQIARVLKDGGFFILIFNTTAQDIWDAIKQFISESKIQLEYLGRFSADYSAGSVVQDNREGALINDWCLVISKGMPASNIAFNKLPSWTNEWL